MIRRRQLACAAVFAAASVSPALAQPVISPPVPLTGTKVPAPVDARSDEGGVSLRVVPLAQGLSHPTGLVFLPDGQTILVVERPGRLRVVKNGVLDPAPVSGVPTVPNLSTRVLRLVFTPDGSFAYNEEPPIQTQGVY